jgi:hypothetical protein
VTPAIPVRQRSSGGLPAPLPLVPRAAAPPKAWQLPAQGSAVLYGSGDTARLSHYFLPRLLREGKRVLFLDGANSADPRLIARFARERGVAFETFSRRIQIARAFTCFQLTELIRRVPQFLRSFPAEVLLVTALPDLYFDEDVRDWDARVAFEQALEGLRRCSTGDVLARQLSDDGGIAARVASPLVVAVFSSAPNFVPSPARRRFFDQTCAMAREVWKFGLSEDARSGLSLVTARAPQLSCAPSRSALRAGNEPQRTTEVFHGPHDRHLPPTDRAGTR